MTQAQKDFRDKYLITPEREGRFWAKVDKSGGAGACWLWTGSVSKHGYGHWRPVQGKNRGDAPTIQLASRVMFGLVNGEEPEMVCHHCDNPRCVNPAHLYAGDATSNVRDMIARGRQNHAMRWPDATVRAVAKAYEGGIGVTEIAKKHGVPVSLVHSIARNTAKARGMRTVRRVLVSRQDVERMREYYAQGASMTTIAAAYGVSISHVSRCMRGDRVSLVDRPARDVKIRAIVTPNKAARARVIECTGIIKAYAKARGLFYQKFLHKVILAGLEVSHA